MIRGRGATPKPLGLAGGNGGRFEARWRYVNKLARALFVFTRSLPEYVLGFLLIAIYGPDPWALVLALAIHNFGILGRLGAEVIENAPPEPARTVIVHGGGRLGAYISTLLPESFNRMVVYFFYRRETCVREATVLGMISVISLGYLADNAKSARAFDQMIFFVLLGAVIVLVGGVPVIFRDAHDDAAAAERQDDDEVRLVVMVNRSSNGDRAVAVAVAEEPELPAPPPNQAAAAPEIIDIV